MHCSLGDTSRQHGSLKKYCADANYLGYVLKRNCICDEINTHIPHSNDYTESQSVDFKRFPPIKFNGVVLITKHVIVQRIVNALYHM